MEKSVIGRLMSVGNTLLTSIMTKTSWDEDERRLSVRSTTPLITSPQVTNFRNSLTVVGEKITISSHKISLENTSYTEESNSTNFERELYLSTDKYKFIGRIPRSSKQERQKWLVKDHTSGNFIALHRVEVNQCSSSASNIQRKKSIPGSCEVKGLDMELFREVILLRCARKCPYILTCQGFALDRQKSLYVSTEYFDGETLENFRKRNPERGAHVTKLISRQLLKALNFLHGCNIVHNNVSSFSVFIRKYAESEISPRGAAEFQLKLFGFEKASDVDAKTKFSGQYHCSKCHDVTHTSDPLYDMLCFGYLLFWCVQGFHPWITSCQCDKDYRKHCKRVVKCKRKNSLMQNFRERLEESFQGDHHVSTISRKWRNLDPRFAKCLTLLLSPSPDDRPSTAELLSGREHHWVFSGTEDNGSWKRRGISDHVTNACLPTSQRLTDSD